MKPWHLQPKAARNWIVRVLLAPYANEDYRHGVAAAAAIAHLESAAPYGDDELVVECNGHRGRIANWHDLELGVQVEIDHEDGALGFWVAECVTPLTPAAASLLDALRGER